MKDHPIAAGVWLMLFVGVVGYFATVGLKSSADHETQEQRKELNKELDEVIEIGRRGEFPLAIQRLEAMVAKHPNEAGLHLNLGIAQRAAEKLDEADKSFGRALELDPKDYDAMAERANVQREKGNLEAALDLMEKIPAGEGRVAMRLRDDPLWLDVSENPRIQALREKHHTIPDTSLQMQRQQEKGAAQGVAVP